MVIIDKISYSDDLKTCLGTYDKVKKVNIIEGCEEIGQNAFSEDDDVEEIVFPSTLKVIGKQSFYGAKSFKNIDLSKTNVEIIKESAFSYTNLENIKFPATLRYIENKAFMETNIIKLNLKNTNLFSIGHLAFADAEFLKEVVLPKALKDIGEGVFESDEKLEKINLENTSLVYLPRNTFNYCKKLSVITLPNSLINIGNRAFSKTNIASLTLPKNVNMISANLFENSNIANVFITGKLTRVENGFSKGNLKTIHVFGIDKETKHILDSLEKDFGIKIIYKDIEHLIDQNKSFKEINNIYIKKAK